jgi:hypothetical protein
LIINKKKKKLKFKVIKKNNYKYFLKCITQYRIFLHSELQTDLFIIKKKIPQFLNKKKIFNSVFRCQIIPQFYNKYLQTLFQFIYLNQIRTYG